MVKKAFVESSHFFELTEHAKQSRTLLFSLFLGIAFVMSVCQANAAEQYQMEISGNYQQTDSRETVIAPFMLPEIADSRASSYGITGKLYFTPVNTSGHPFAEAAYLERASSALFSFNRLNRSEGSVKENGTDLQFMLALAKPGFPLTFEASFNEVKIRPDNDGSYETKEDIYAASLGGFFSKTWLTGIDFRDTKESASFSTANFSVLDYGLFTKYVLELDNGGGADLQARIGQTRAESSPHPVSTNGSFLFVYYWTRSFSTGIGWKSQTEAPILQIASGKTYSAKIQYFFTSALYLSGFYDRFLTSDPSASGDSKSLVVVLAARF